jgi:N utilization substance protein B
MTLDTRRRQARELSLQVLFQEEYLKGLNVDDSLSYFKGQFEAHEEVLDFARRLLKSALENKAEIDKLIQDFSQNWNIKRMASVDVIILRIAISELIFMPSEVPMAATINEALEIAKKYSTTESSPFINGILDQIAKEKGVS